MDKKRECSLWIFASRTDIAFMSETVSHIVRMCNYPFKEKVLAIDVADPSGEKTLRPHLAKLSEVREACEKLRRQGIVDRIVDMDYSAAYKKKIYKKHFGASHLRQTHNWKGYPILGSMYCIEEAKTDYVLHFDSDMLMYQKKGYDWISRGINELEKDPELLWVRCQAGPKKRLEEKGDRRTAFFSRVYLMDRRRLKKLLPMRPLWAPPKMQGRIKGKIPSAIMEPIYYISGKGALDSWEKIMSLALKRKNIFGKWMNNNNDCWTLHPSDHGEKYIEAMPEIIKRLEVGDYPVEQLDQYDLDLKAWLKYVGK